MIWKREDNGCFVLAVFNDCTLYKGLTLFPHVLTVLLQQQQEPLDAASQQRPHAAVPSALPPFLFPLLASHTRR